MYPIKPIQSRQSDISCKKNQKFEIIATPDDISINWDDHVPIRPENEMPSDEEWWNESFME